MGIRRLSEPVVDAGPLIHLAEIDALDVLSIFDRIHIPNAVWDEAVIRHAVPAEAVERACDVVRHSVEMEAERYAVEAGLQSLQRGERECLYVCDDQRLGLLLTDDLAVRRRASTLGLTPVGSLGVIVRAFRLNRIDFSTAEERIEALHSVSSLFVTRALVDIAIVQLRGAGG